MKKQVISLSLIAATLIVGCNMNKDKNSADTIPTGTDSSMMGKTDSGTTGNMKSDTSTNHIGSATIAGDTSAATANAAASKDTSKASGKTAAAKTGKKGKVSIALNTKGTGAMTADKEGYYANTEILPAFPGGQKALERFFEDNLQYPQDATDNDAEGTVNMNFAVDENGKVYAPKVVSKNIGHGIEEEALRVFNKMPTWTPGKIKGKNVKTRYTLPIKFQLY